MTDINFLAYSFIVEQEDGMQDRISYCAKQVPPKKGDYVWMPFNWERKTEFGTRSFIVEDIAHHLPFDGFKGTYDNIVVYCKPVLPDGEGNYNR